MRESTRNYILYEMSQYARFLYIVLIALASSEQRLCISAVSPEPSFLAYTKYGGKEGLRPKIRPPTQLDTPAREFIRGFGAYAIRAEISCAGPGYIL